MDTKEKERTRRTQSARPPVGSSRRTEKTRPAEGKRSSSVKKPAAPMRNTSEQKARTTQRPSAAESRSANKTRQQTRRRKPSQTKQKRSIAEDIVYLPPKPFSRRRLLLMLSIVVTVVFAIMVGISIFFRVEQVVISGCEKYTVDMILEASEIRVESENQRGDSLLTFSRAKAGGKIIGKLPFVENVRFGIKLPGTVYIEITEVEVSYAAEDTNGAWWLISAGGKVLQQLSGGENSGYTNVLGFKLDKPVIGSQAVPLEEEQPATDEAGNTIPVVLTAQKRLNAALNILQYMEQNGIIGEAASVDVSDLGDISIQYGTRYLIKLGNDTELFEKVKLLKSAVAKVSEDYPYSTGTIDLSDLKKIRFDQTDS